ncbi:MAG: kelch repeat-containing protein [Ardenticatenaceae bacterium]|nr:kelch repeat-containing protein [Ardenticatenaceae bacterium]
MAELNETLSERELDVLALVVKGASNKEIAQELFISPNTVKVHLRNIYTKLGVSTRTEATVAAVEKKLITLSGDISLSEAESEAENKDLENLNEDQAAEISLLTSETDPLPNVESQTEVDVAQEPDSTTSSAGRWLWPVITLLAIVVALVSVFAQRLPGLTEEITATETPIPEEDVQIQDTRWFVSQAVDQPVWGGVLVNSGVDLYQIGGLGADNEVTDRAIVYDSSTREWSAIASKPTAVSDAGGVNLGGIVYLVGGKDAEGNPVNVAEAYSPSDNLWGSVADLPQPRYGGLVVEDGVNLYYLGGHNGDEVVDDAFVYDPATNGWRALPPLPEPQAYAAGGFMENSLFVVGGENEDGILDICQRFDLQLESWSECPPLSQPRTRAGAAVVLNKLYLLGGETEAYFGELLDPRTGVWQIINVPMLTADGASDWMSPGVTNIAAKIYLIGGQLATGTVNDNTYVYAPLVYQSFLPATEAGEAPEP